MVRDAILYAMFGRFSETLAVGCPETAKALKILRENAHKKAEALVDEVSAQAEAIVEELGEAQGTDAMLIPVAALAVIAKIAEASMKGRMAAIGMAIQQVAAASVMEKDAGSLKIFLGVKEGE